MRQPFIRLLVAVLLALSAPGAHAEAPLSPSQVLNFRRVADLRFSPDGSRLAFVVYSYAWDWRPTLWQFDVVHGVTREMTPAGGAERSPQWSPDGKTLAYLSSRGASTQIYTIPANGGTTSALTATKTDIESFRWSPEGQSIAYLAQDENAPADDSGPQIADDERSLSRLWVLDVGSKHARRLATAGYRIDEFQWLDPSHVLIVASDAPRIEEFNDAIFSVDTHSGAIVAFARPPQPFQSLSVAPDGSRFAVRATGNRGPIARDLFVGSAGGKSLRDVSIPVERAVTDTRWQSPQDIWIRVIDGFENRLVHLRPDGTPEAVSLPLSVDTFDVAHDGVIAFAGSSFDRLAEIYVRTKDGKIRQVSHLQQGPDDRELAPATVFHTKSFDGTDIESALLKPPHAKASRLPLVLLVHGGPSSNFSASFGWDTAWAQMLASHGYEVLMANPRGSNGYSENFVKANRGDWGGGDYKDLMAVLDAVIARGDTDPGRLGIGGWSYGGEMSEWAITQTGRFRAAVAGAGVFDQQAEFETEDDPAGDEWYFGTPWEHPDVFARNSPASFIRRAHTPTLILDGENDASNPVGQSKGLYRALKHFGVETQMVLYPGEGHSPRRKSYNVDMFTRILGWYDRHLRAGATAAKK